ncbi:MAG: hypothetical protein WBL39_10600, partial [Terrimicrobiaceae bacterium]
DSFSSLEMAFLSGWFWFRHRHQTKHLRAFRVFCTGISVAGIFHGTVSPLLFWLPQLATAYAVAHIAARYAKRSLQV